MSGYLNGNFPQTSEDRQSKRDECGKWHHLKQQEQVSSDQNTGCMLPQPAEMQTWRIPKTTSTFADKVGCKPQISCKHMASLYDLGCTEGAGRRNRKDSAIGCSTGKSQGREGICLQSHSSDPVRAGTQDLWTYRTPFSRPPPPEAHSDCWGADYTLQSTCCGEPSPFWLLPYTWSGGLQKEKMKIREVHFPVCWSEVKVAQSCLTLCDPIDYTVHNSPGQNTGVGSVAFSRGFSQTRDRTRVSCTAGRFFTSWATRAVC